MKCLYAPWRSDYTKSTHSMKNDPQECVFCSHVQHPEYDASYFVLRRFSHTFVMFNKFPYNPGHLLVVPFEHIGNLHDLSAQTRAQLIEVCTQATIILGKQARSESFNVGLNIGAAAGASIPTHLHMHVLPRWIGDTNFLPTLSETKVISSDLEALYLDLKPHFDAMTL